MDKILKQKIFRGIIIIGITTGVYFVIQNIVPLVIPFIFALIIAFMINPIVGFLQRRLRMSRGIAAIISFVGVISIIISVIIFLWNNLQKQIKNFIIYFPVYEKKLMELMENCCCDIDNFLCLKSGESKAFIEDNLSGIMDGFKENIAPSFTHGSMNVLTSILGIIVMVFLIFIATISISRDFENIKNKIKNSYFGSRLKRTLGRLKGVLKAYIKAQFIIMLINASICTIALFFVGNSYPILFGMLIGFVDALPILGSGSILIPWGIVLLLMEEYKNAIFIFLAYLSCNLVRQIIEPKVIGQKIGVNSLFTLMMMYVGYKLFGFKGFIFGPIGFIVGREVYYIFIDIFEPIFIKE